MTLGRGARITASLAGAVAIGGAFVVSGVTLCPFAALTGVPCPGCGLGRAALALARGDVHAAMHLHPLVFVVLPALAVGALHVMRPERFSARASRLAVAGGAAVLLTAMLGLWGARFAGEFGGPVPVASLWARATR